MLEQQFLEVSERAGSFMFRSTDYTEYANVADSRILHNDASLILFGGYNAEAGMTEYHYAANDAETLAAELPDEGSYYLTFVPASFVPALEKKGLYIRSAWHDYFNLALSNVTEPAEPLFLTSDDSCEISDVFMSCRGQSRGFTGQTPGWVRAWFASDDPRYPTAVGARAEDGTLMGVVLTGVYGFDCEKGPVVWIREVGVRPAYRRRGVAGRLIRQAMLYGRAHGATRAFLAVDEDNTGAIRLYEQLGFVASEGDSEINMCRSDGTGQGV